MRASHHTLTLPPQPRTSGLPHTKRTPAVLKTGRQSNTPSTGKQDSSSGGDRNMEETEHYHHHHHHHHHHQATVRQENEAIHNTTASHRQHLCSILPSRLQSHPRSIASTQLVLTLPSSYRQGQCYPGQALYPPAPPGHLTSHAFRETVTSTETGKSFVKTKPKTSAKYSDGQP